MAISEEFKEWDEIFKQRDEYLEENPDSRNQPRPKTFKDQDNNVRCTKCGATDDIGGCIDCKSEKEFLNS